MVQPFPASFGSTNIGLPRLPTASEQMGMIGRQCAEQKDTTAKEEAKIANEEEAIANAPEQAVMERQSTPESTSSKKIRTPFPRNATKTTLAEDIKENIPLPSCLQICCTISDRRIDEPEMLEKTWWCYYCCCCGLGCGSWVHQRSLLKLTCCLTECESMEIFDQQVGTFSWIWSCAYCHFLGQMPRLQGTPKCICWDEMYGHDAVFRDDYNARRDKDINRNVNDAADHEDDPIQTFDHVLMSTFTLCYYSNFGISMSPLIIRPSVCTGACKWCCCQSSYEIVHPWDEEFGCCTHLLTCMWFYFTCRLPALTGDKRQKKYPIITCCGKKILPMKSRRMKDQFGQNTESEEEESPWYRPVQLPGPPQV